MKKVLIIIMLLFIPFVVNAKEYQIKDTDATINIDDEMWYVFTRDNLKDNEDLKNLEISEEYVKAFMEENNVYLNAHLFSENGNLELNVRKVSIESINNLSNYPTKDIKKLAKELAEKQKAKKYNAYENKYKYAHLDYYDSGYYLDEYYTIVNKEAYTITAQSDKKLTKEQKQLVKQLVDSIEYKINPKYKNDQINTWWKSIGMYAIIGAVLGGLTSIFSSIAGTRKVNNKKETN